MQRKSELEREGLVILPGFFESKRITELRESAQRIFEVQFQRLEYRGSFQEKMIRLFREEESVFINCGKIIQQGLIELYKIAVDPVLLKELQDLGVSLPNMCTRPVLFFNHPALAKEERYYKTPLHQDWPSMQASLDSLVVWIPLVDVSPENGSVVFYPRTHKLGNICDSVEGGFAKITQADLSGYPPLQPKMQVGDIAVFSTFLVHKSGEISNDEIRWSCHFRYTNMLEEDFVKRGFPNPYVYAPTIQK